MTAHRILVVEDDDLRLLLTRGLVREGFEVRCRDRHGALRGWPAGAIVHDNTLDQYVSRLRRKLRTRSAQVRIATAHGTHTGCVEARADGGR